MRARLTVAAGAALLLGAALAGPAGGQDTPPPAAAPPPASAPAEAAACADCHEEANTFSKNPHARPRHGVTDAGGALCATCHGDGAAHAEAGGDKSLIQVVRGAAGTPVCLTCHDSHDANVSLRAGVHARGEAVNCLTCHAIHTADPAAGKLLVKPVQALCASCHQSQTASHEVKPFAHKLGRGGMSCVSCHDPHGAQGKGALRMTRDAELPCLSCHVEKRGPFVFPHGVAGDCLTCHEPHGSSNPKRLVRADVQPLCLRCHSTLTPGLIGSQPPSVHDLLSPRWRNCTTCHVAVHGSNRSPRLFK